MDLNEIVNKNKEIEYKILGDETLILVPEEGKFYELNTVGTRIWQLINGKRTVKEIIRRVYEEFEVKETKAREDIVDYIQKLKKKKLCVCVGKISPFLQLTEE
jgi:hypothetical protein